MRIIPCEQNSDEWQRWRARPTASCFHRFITPARGDYSKQSTAYAAEIVAKRLGLFVETVPTFWMENGTDAEPSAAIAYEKQFGVKTTKVGFVLPDHTDAMGCSPDRLVNLNDDHTQAEGIVEFKCPKAETLIRMHADNDFGEMYSKPQVQGQLLITGCKYADFYVWHQDLVPYHVRFEPDEEYQAKIAAALLLFMEEITRVESCVRKMKHEIVAVPMSKTELNWET